MKNRKKENSNNNNSDIRIKMLKQCLNCENYFVAISVSGVPASSETNAFALYVDDSFTRTHAHTKYLWPQQINEKYFIND